MKLYLEFKGKYLNTDVIWVLKYIPCGSYRKACSQLKEKKNIKTQIYSSMKEKQFYVS